MLCAAGSRRITRASIALGAAFAVSAGGLAGWTDAASASSPEQPEPESAVSAAGIEQLEWRRCGGKAFRGFQCARLAVPKDYDNPNLGTFSLAVVRLKATGPKAKRKGSLFFNPGGPGVSGVDLAPDVAGVLPENLRRRFHFVTWDPRGVGRSAGLNRCSPGLYRIPETGRVNWDAVLDQMRAAEAAANAECHALYPGVVPYIGTNATVRDLDRLRAAVGDRRLTYWGTSYGTRIGYVYAHDFPDRVRAMLLTSSVDPNATWPGFLFASATASDTALGLLFEAFPAATKHYRRALSVLNQHTLKLPSGATFTRWHLAGMLAAEAPNDANYAELATFLRNVALAVRGRGRARVAALRALDRHDWPDGMAVNGGATPFIGCSDYEQRMTPDEQDRLAARIRAQAPITGAGTTQGLVYCEGITVTPDPVPVDFVNRSTPMLIMGSTRDALTPYTWTSEMARTFRNSRVVTYVGGTHTPFLGAGSKCVDRYGVRYLLKRKRPRVDVACQSILR